MCIKGGGFWWWFNICREYWWFNSSEWVLVVPFPQDPWPKLTNGQHSWKSPRNFGFLPFFYCLLLIPGGHCHDGCWENQQLHQWCPLFPVKLLDFIHSLNDEAPPDTLMTTPVSWSWGRSQRSLSWADLDVFPCRGKSHIPAGPR